jgi:hypothetical protein
MKKLVISTAVFLVFAAGSASAASITGLYNTGVDSTGTILSNGSADTHYTLAVVNGQQSNHTDLTPGTSTPYASSTGWPIGNDSANGTTGTWIGPGSNPVSSWLTLSSTPGTSYDPTTAGEYIFTTTFSLNPATVNLNSASISGKWSADNYGTMKLNGNLISTIADPRATSAADGAAYDKWTSFSISGTTAGFQPGTNVITFDVHNIALSSGNPFGVRAEFTSSISPVPEPETYAMLLAGLGLIGAAVKRRKAKQA